MESKSVSIKPFIKWAGGKYKLAEQLLEHLPKSFNHNKNKLIEPMVGSGGFFFRLSPKRAYLSDINKNLITTYEVVKNNVEDLTMKLESYKKLHLNEEYYKEQRNLFNELIKEDKNKLEIAALFIYLNKTCFNGLYRENSKGEFNVPVGRNSNGDLLPMSVDISNLFNVSKLLKDVDLCCHSYEKCLGQIKRGDFVYIDPPYIPVDVASFTQYSKSNFGLTEHIELSSFLEQISEKGAFFMLSNSDTEDTREIYNNKTWKIAKYSVSRSIASNAKNRGKAKEVVITNF
jgi:DNA adenine methylase